MMTFAVFLSLSARSLADTVPCGPRANGTKPKTFVGLCGLGLKGADLIDRRHRDARVDGTHEFGLLFGIDPIAELGEAIVQPLPEGDTAGDGLRRPDRAEGCDMLVVDPTADAAGRNKADLQPIRGLSEAGKHGRCCSGIPSWRF